MKKEAFNYYQEWLKREPDFESRNITRDLSLLDSLIPSETKIHVIGICGKGTATLAGLLKEKGFIVSGSDENFYPPMSNIVDELGIRIYKSYDANNIQDADIVVVGNVCPPTHVEVLAAKEKNILQISMSEALEHLIISDTKNIVVTGTHGKTTLTGMITWMLEKNNISPTAFIGGVVQGEARSYYSGNSDYSVLEGDEYDTSYFDKGPKFLHYKPWCGIITSCEYDHVTMYSSFNEYKQAFKFFINEINPSGYLIIHESVYALVNDALPTFSGTMITYGPSADCDYAIMSHSNENGLTKGIVKNKDDKFTLETYHSGLYNLENTLAAYIAGTACGIESKNIAEALLTFPGMERRQQIIFENSDYLFIDDFAHHPTAVRVTLDGLREKFPTKRIVCLFEPRSSSSRKKIFEKPYSESFENADIIAICAPELRENDDKNDFVDIKVITDFLEKKNKTAVSFSKPSEIIPWLTETLQPNDLIVTMSNASFDNIQESIKEILQKKSAY
jgi:UDP-N-acetylmuramate: L-alanyl-gamma-D-glutamyl-meso-diaminopimelate ligase